MLVSLVRAVWKAYRRSRGALFRVAVVCVCVALSAAVLGGAPARAAVGAAQSTPPAAIPVNPGTDFTLSVPLADTTTADADTYITKGLPEELGLPDGASPSDVEQALYKQATAGHPGADLGAPPAFTGGSMTASSTSSGTELTLTIPADQMPTGDAATATLPYGRLGSALAGAFTNVGTEAFEVPCDLAVRRRLGEGSKAAVLAKATCVFLAATVSNLMGNALSSVFSGSPFDASAFVTTLVYNSDNAGSPLFQGLQGALYVYSPWIKNMVDELLPVMADALHDWIWGEADLWLEFPSQVASTLPSVADVLSAYTQQGLVVQPRTGSTENTAFAEAGMATVLAQGLITDTAVKSGTSECMDAYGAGGSPADGQPVDINTCSADSADQTWDQWSNDQVSNDGLCLGGDQPSGLPFSPPPTPMALKACGAPNGAFGTKILTWHQGRATSGFPPFIIEGPVLNSTNTGQCVDDPNFDTSPGTQLYAKGCTGTTAQRWLLPSYTASGTYPTVPTVTDAGAVKSRVAGQCMEAAGASPGQGVTVNGCDGNPEQQWDVDSDGTLEIWALCLDTSRSGVGALAELEQCGGASSQVWTAKPNGELVQGGSGLCLEDPGGSTKAGTQLDTGTCNGAADQQWTLPPAVPVETPPPPPSGASVCDIYSSDQTPCVAAYSTTRALYSGYDGPLYQVTRSSDNTTNDIGLLAKGGDVNASEQDKFCANTLCTITKIYGQAPSGTTPGSNTLTPGPGGEADPTPDQPADADALKITVDGNEAYGVDITGGMGYRDDATTGIAKGSAPEGMYMVASGTHVNSQCCTDFGNAETTNNDDGGGAMDALNVSTRCNRNYGATCNGTGPWVQADLENGLFQDTGTSENANDTSNTSDFVTAVLKNNGTSSFELEGGDAQSGTLGTLYNGPLPTKEGSNTWAPMSKQGAIVLGVGGDNSSAGTGSFFEGVMTEGTPTDAADAAVQANIVAAQYGGDSAGSGVSQNADAGVVNSGITYDFSVDAKNGDLQESSLTAQGANWATQDLSAAGTPPVEQGTTPVAVVHDGVTSVFTISATDDHLWETHMRPGVTSWKADDLTVIAKTPPAKVTPSALFHDGYTTVYTIDASNGHLQTTYLKVLNGPWATSDLTAQAPGAPAAQPGTSPASILHDGVASVFTVGTDHDIWETYLPSIDGTWSAHDITALSSGPQTASTVTAVFHQGALTVFAAGDPLRHLWKLALPSPGASWTAQDLTAAAPDTPSVAPGTSPAALFHDGYTSVYTVDETTLDLRTTYLPSLGSAWATENLSADYKTPPTTETPVPLLHPGINGALDRLSVFTVNYLDTDLQDTYLVAEGDPWTTQDMNFLAGVPPVTVDASPTATWSVAADGVTYAFSTDPGTGDLMVTWLTAQGAAWQKMDLTAAGVAPQPGTFPAAVAWDGHVTVFSVGTPKGHLWATTLNAPGGTWTGTDLTAVTGGPPTAEVPTAVFHGGQLCAFTVDHPVDSGNDPGDLEQYYLPLGSATWSVLDLTTATGGPQVAAGSSPSALYHDGYTSVYINATGTHHLQNYFLTAIGNPWAVQDLTDIGGADTLAAESSPAALYHSGYVTVFSVGNLQGDIWETSLPAIGDSWASQDLTKATGVPPEPLHLPGSDGPIPLYLGALYHSGYASVYSVDASGGLNTTFLPAIGGTWQTQDLTTTASVPLSTSLFGPSALLHYDANGGLTRTSVFTINEFGGAGDPAHGTLQDTDLVKIGDSWATQTLPD